MSFSQANKLRVLYFLVLSCTASWLPIFADDLQNRGFTGLEIAMILSATPITMFLIQPWCGALADRFGLRPYMIVSSALASVAFLLLVLDNAFYWLLILTCLMSIFYNGLQPVLDSLTLKLEAQREQRGYGGVRIAGAVGWAATGAVAGLLIDTYGTRVIYLVSSITLCLTCLIAFSLNEDRSASKNSQEQISVQHLLANRSLLFLLVVVFLISAAATTIWNFYSIYMKENGASAALVGYGLSLQGLCEIPLFYFSALIIRSMGLRATFIITALATAVRLALYGVIDNPVYALFIEILHGFSWSLFWVCCVEYVDVLVPDNRKATGQSLLYASYFGIGAIAGNFWTGHLYDLKYSLSMIFLLNAVVVLAVVVAIAIFLKTAPAKTSQSLS